MSDNLPIIPSSSGSSYTTAQVAERAQRLWSRVEEQGRQAEDLFSPWLSLYDFARDLLRAAAQENGGGGENDVDITFLTLPEEKKAIEAATDSAGRKGPAASWLFRAGTNTPIIYVDFALLREEIELYECQTPPNALFAATETDEADKNASRQKIEEEEYFILAKAKPVLMAVLLHEIGHVALHWSFLKPKTVGENFVSAASANHESEAWTFAGTLWGLALGDISKRVVEKKKTIDNAWKHIIQQHYPTVESD